MEWRKPEKETSEVLVIPKIQLTIADMLIHALIISVWISLGDGHSFDTRLVHIDPEQANSVLQQNGKRWTFFKNLINVFQFSFLGVDQKCDFNYSLVDEEGNTRVLGNNVQHSVDESKEKTGDAFSHIFIFFHTVFDNCSFIISSSQNNRNKSWNIYFVQIVSF